jgi:hypothetical protein
MTLTRTYMTDTVLAIERTDITRIMHRTAMMRSEQGDLHKAHRFDGAKKPMSNSADGMAPSDVGEDAPD